jgi:hypothetical protein
LVTAGKTHVKMCDENRLKLQEEIIKQGEIVRKLKATQGSKDKVSRGDFAVRVLCDVIELHHYRIAFMHFLSNKVL